MPQWTEDQLIIAIEFYYTCRENMHTDSHPMCKEIAVLTNHTASALDRVLRNIKYADLGQAGLPHVSRKARRLVDRYRDNPGALRADAARIRAANGWGNLICHD